MKVNPKSACCDAPTISEIKTNSLDEIVLCTRCRKEVEKRKRELTSHEREIA